jgi:superoxide reductase
MVEVGKVYRCEVCGNTALVLEAHPPVMVCCNQDMQLMKEHAKEDELNEKHVPVVTVEGNNITVKVGSVPHPMEDTHYIETIMLVQDNKVVALKQLKAGEEPEAKFCLDNTENLVAKELCNKHGLWTS